MFSKQAQICFRQYVPSINEPINYYLWCATRGSSLVLLRYTSSTKKRGLRLRVRFKVESCFANVKCTHFRHTSVCVCLCKLCVWWMYYCRVLMMMVGSTAAIVPVISDWSKVDACSRFWKQGAACGQSVSFELVLFGECFRYKFFTCQFKLSRGKICTSDMNVNFSGTKLDKQLWGCHVVAWQFVLRVFFINLDLHFGSNLDFSHN